MKLGDDALSRPSISKTTGPATVTDKVVQPTLKQVFSQRHEQIEYMYLERKKEITVDGLVDIKDLPIWLDEVIPNNIVDGQTMSIGKVRITCKQLVSYHHDLLSLPPPREKPATPTPVTRPPTTVRPISSSAA